ncbi:DUF3857 domain-containing protein [Sphingobacterium faecale]|uniref:DUF3857 domain-containing protein n=1 Tax=Sphingobacterium faecale TaxID=2803775 RepID=A0ABS1R200_9SPHI|nr:DUF3857 domain-containing protein [Sphingobacterium faecale]MBL1408732.1 DUF3857 domain-containing protein [Sphingobacterium faecale]
MQLIRTSALAVLFIFLQIIGFAKSPSLTKAPVPDWIRQKEVPSKMPDLEDISDGYYFESIEYQVNLSLQSRFYRTVKVLTENAGAENAGQIHISFVPQYQTLVLHELYLLRDGKRLDRLNLSKFELLASETELSRSIYNGTYSAYLLLDDLRKDDKIVMSYSVVGFNPVFGGRFFDSYVLQGFEPTGALHINYIVPKQRKLYFKTFLGADSPKEKDLGTAISYYWEMPSTTHVAYDFNTPIWYPTRQRMECSEFEKWSDVAKWADDVNPIPLPAATGKLREFADQLWLKAKKDSIAYVKEVADFVQNEIRYMGVEVGEYSHRANEPEKVFAQRYGDCKDKSVLMATMLKHRGIKSRLVLVNSWEEYNMETYLPSPNAFNHMVLYFILNDRGQYIDPTITNQGGNIRDRYFPFYGKVLHVQPGGKMYDTEKIVSGNTRIEERFHIQKDGTAILDVLTIYTGANAENTRSYFKQTAKNQIEKSNIEYYQKLYKQVKKRTPLHLEDDIANNVFRVKESYTIDKIIELDPTTNRSTVYAYASSLSLYIPEIIEPRTTPIALSYPLALEHDVYIINPNSVNVPALSENIYESRDSYYFGKSITTNNDTLKVAFRLGFHDTHVKVDQVDEFMSDFSDLNNIFTCAVYMDDDGFVTGSNTQNKTNWWAVSIFLVLLALFTWLTIKYYHKRSASSVIYLYDNAEYDAVGGWLILLALALFASPLRVFFNLMVPYMFSLQVWNTFGYYTEMSKTLLSALLVFEFVINTLIFFLSCYCFYLLIKRRDIFPQTLLALLLLQIVFTILDTVAASVLFSKPPETFSEYAEIFRTIIFGIIWILYLLNSTRVKGTFVVKANDKVEVLPTEDIRP